MQTQLDPRFAATHWGGEAERILRQCVHCGFCTATCPTYQILGNELDGPRGRIYLIKQVLEGTPPTRITQRHLDRCLTCRNCETTCPSGVDYGHLLDIGRRVVDAQVKRPWYERWLRRSLAWGLTSNGFAPALKLGQWLRPLLPKTWANKIPAPPTSLLSEPSVIHTKKVLLLEGCVQDALSPNINLATKRLLNRLQIQTITVKQAKCCGAVSQHLGYETQALDQMKANIDAWWSFIESQQNSSPVEALLVNASGCTVMVKDYGYALAGDPIYAHKAKKISQMTYDLSEYLLNQREALVAYWQKHRSEAVMTIPLAYHPPCTLQHGQRLQGVVESLFMALGLSLQLAKNEPHLCCGSAGTYSILQPLLSNALRERKLAQWSLDEASLQKDTSSVRPAVLLTSNIGCMTHLQQGTSIPVMHWAEWLERGFS